MYGLKPVPFKTLESAHCPGARVLALPDILGIVILRSHLRFLLAVVLALPIAIAGCHKGEQAVEGVAKNAVNAEHTAQANATQLDQQRAQLAQIPLPTKSMYVDVHDPSQWSNPLIVVGPDYVTLRVLMADVNTSTVGEGTLLRPEAARRQELQVRLVDLDRAIAALPMGAWHYGRVIAVQESSEAPAKDQPMVRRNLEAVMRRLNDLGVVVEEWPSR
jgi:hypothetical protein